MKRWSTLQRDLYSIIDTSIDFQIHCTKYRMQSKCGSTDLPRYWITLGGEIIFEYPKQFVNENGDIKNLSKNKANRFNPCISKLPTNINYWSGS